MLLDKLVIGSCTESALYAFLTDSYYLPNNTFGPIFYEELPIKVFGSTNSRYTWSRCLLTLSLQGRLLSYSEKKKIIIRENRVKILEVPAGPIEYDFQDCKIFDTTDLVLENSIATPKEDSFLVYDDFELSNLGARNKYIKPKSDHSTDLASKIVFYSSDRVPGAKYVTDCLVESCLTKEQVYDINYSDSIVRFFVSRYLEEVGVKGVFMKFYKNGKSKFRKPKIIHKSRKSFRKSNNIYSDSDSIKFVYEKKEALVDFFGTAWS